MVNNKWVFIYYGIIANMCDVDYDKLYFSECSNKELTKCNVSRSLRRQRDFGGRPT